METKDRVEATMKEVQADLDHGNFYSICGNETLFKNYLRNKLTTHEREAVEAERKEWLSGNRCSLCGGSNLDSKGLSDVCGQCYEEQ